MGTKELLGLSQDMQALALVGNNYSFAKKKKKKVGDFLGVGVSNIVGTQLIKEQADITTSF